MFLCGEPDTRLKPEKFQILEYVSVKLAENLTQPFPKSREYPAQFLAQTANTVKIYGKIKCVGFFRDTL